MNGTGIGFYGTSTKTTYFLSTNNNDIVTDLRIGNTYSKRFKKIALENHLVLSFFMTTLCCVVAFCGAFLLRFDLFSIPAIYQPCLWIGLPIMLAIRLVTLSIFKVHRGLYRYVSLHDFVNLSKAITLGTLVFMVLWMLLLNDSYFMPRSIFVLEALLSMSLLSGLRISVRLWRSNRQQRER